VFWFTVRAEAVLSSEPEEQRLCGEVLVLDPHTAGGEMLACQLERLGCLARIVTAEELHDALEAAHGSLRAALVDSEVSDAQGRRVLDVVREAWPSLAVVPLVSGTVTTGTVTTEGARLVRPVRRSRLVKAILAASNEVEPLRPGPRPEPEDAAVTGAALNVLLAEDNRVNQRVASAILEHSGCRVTVVANGRGAVEALRSEAFDLVVMDCQMPEMDGYEATVAIRDPASGVLDPQVPIIAMTAHAVRGDRERCLAVGMDDYVVKPVHPEQLRAAIRRCLHGRDQGS
jgi:CheY-like chemotaxis protein